MNFTSNHITSEFIVTKNKQKRVVIKLLNKTKYCSYNFPKNTAIASLYVFISPREKIQAIYRLEHDKPYGEQIQFFNRAKIIIDNNNCNLIIKSNQPIHTKDFQTISIEFFTEHDIKKPKLCDDGSFYIMYSPEKIKLRPRDSTMLNLPLKVHLPD